MVTIAWVGKPAIKGWVLFLLKAKKKLNALLTLFRFCCFPIVRLLGQSAVGLVAVGIVLVSVPVAF